jgi:FtsZ-binding cell division protein ZapB
MVKTGRTVELEPIDRLEEKVKLLVNMIDRLKGDAARLAEDNARLARELEMAHAQISEAESASGEMVALREERDLVRARVATMLEQLEGLTL